MQQSQILRLERYSVAYKYSRDSFLKQNASQVVARAAAGEVVTVTDRRRPVAQLVPVPGGASRRADHFGSGSAGEGLPCGPWCANRDEFATARALRGRSGHAKRRTLLMAFYLDTSAAAKLVVAESRSEAMASWAATHEARVIASDLLRTELLRATRQAAPDRMQCARAVLDSLTLFSLTSATFERAATLDRTELRSLDALHLAAALELGDELDGIVTCDERMGTAATLYGVAVMAPT